MPRYFFSTVNGDVHRDTDGTDLPSLGDARIEGARLIGLILQDRPQGFWEAGDLKLTVSNDRGLALFTIVVAAIDAASTSG
jgi:hypothetical protein